LSRNGGGVIANNHSVGIGWADDDAAPAPTITYHPRDRSFTNVSVLNLRPGNFLDLYGGTVGGDFNGTANGEISTSLLRGWGLVKGSLTITNNGFVGDQNSVGVLTVQP